MLSVVAVVLLAVAVLAVVVSVLLAFVTDSVRSVSLGNLAELADYVARSMSHAYDGIVRAAATLGFSKVELEDAASAVAGVFGTSGGSIGQTVSDGVDAVRDFVTNGVLAVIFCVYFLIDAHNLATYWDRTLRSLMGTRAYGHLHAFALDVRRSFAGYMRGQFIDAMLMGIAAGVALAYWILFLRNYLPLRSYPAVAPAGFGAGQMGTVLTMAGADLSLMAFSWAQLGYVTLRMDRRGRVFIYKQMDMGNERSTFEQKCFYQMFSRRQVVDTGASYYQRLCQAVGMQRTAKELFRTKNPLSIKIFRFLLAVAGLFSGACFGIILGNMLDYGWFFMIILATVGLGCSWQMQFWPDGWLLHHHPRLWMAAVFSLLWLILGISVGQFPLALGAVAIQILGGFLASFGGRRTEDGRNAMGQIFSLRRYYTKLTPAQVHQISRNNPDVFFDLAPNALALGCDRSLAKRFGRERLTDCPYIQVADSRGLTATQWSQLMRHMLSSMTSHQRRSAVAGFRSVMNNYMK